eukprot:TRINITY_DN12319_c0_g1_i7.p1 TRINITY_DN12319_c0_g1~~TRINITY_DN12319_c0_g1_i7.p1  ORF type:complete len:437 (+),score=120.35 TRINITY_DN12319_c0_g1_i7:208-1518(+)
MLIMGSIRRPKAVTIHGNDEKEYRFLIKGGEDLRLDQRIEQLFAVMNEILARDAMCGRRGLKLVTYEVVPMTRRLGVLQWLQNTAPLKLIILSGFPDPQHNAARVMYHDYFFKADAEARAKNAYAAAFVKMLEKVKDTDVEKNIRACEDHYPEDLLLRNLLSLCASHEAFLTVRSTFASTFAVISMCCYVLGLGDRHLENFLLDKTSGSVVSIDFGAAFGVGLSLAVPELMPFRLTRQFVHVLRPLDTTGLLKHDMVYTLQALRHQRQMLLTVMEVFVKEPTLDWLNAAQDASAASNPSSGSGAGGSGSGAASGSGSGGASGSAGSSASGSASSTGNAAAALWYPRRKINIAKLKLEGYNPSYVMIREMEETVPKHAGSKYFGRLQQVIRGSRNRVRSQAPYDTPLSVEKQVECLIDHATDGNILGRTFEGWMPFI